MVYGSLIKDDGLGKNVQLIVVTRHAAGAVRLPKRALDGSSHPTALRLTMAERLSLQKLWTRVHMTQAERKVANDTLPMRCGPAWFRSRFLGEHAPKRLGPADDVWPHVSATPNPTPTPNPNSTPTPTPDPNTNPDPTLPLSLTLTLTR